MSEPVLNYQPFTQYAHERSAVAVPTRDRRAVGRFDLSFPQLDQFFLMPNRTSALATILRSPMRILGLVLMLVFVAEVAVMFVLPYVLPGMLSESGKAVVDALLLTLVCAPALWLVIIGPLRRIAIQEHERSETIVARASESILTFDLNGNVLSCNRAASDLFDLDTESLMARSIHAGAFNRQDSR